MTTIWMSQWSAHFRPVIALIESLPDFAVLKLLPTLKPILDLRVSIRNQVQQILSQMNKPTVGTKDFRGSGQDTIFDEMLASKTPSSELTHDRLSQEAIGLTTAGVETVKATMTYAIYHCLEDPAVGARLKAELVEAIPNPAVIPPWVELEKLPYLTGVINESR
jgi:cytochrome P450